MPESTPANPATVPGLTSNELASHYQRVAKHLLEGTVAPFLGAGVNLCDRPQGFTWAPEQESYLPRGSELAAFLAREFACPDYGRDLLQVALYGETKEGRRGLYDELDMIFKRRYPVTSVHRFLASLPMPAPAAKSAENRFPLLATTNYDDLIEQALATEGRAFDLIFYLPEDERRGSFWHEEPGGTPRRIPVGDANAYSYPFFEHWPVVLKIHGTVNRADPALEGYVISEDHYIDYLAEEALERLLPARIVAKLRRSRLWFLGYSLSDWNFRVFLRRLRRSERLQYIDWAIKAEVRPDEKQYWLQHKVEVIPIDLREYIPALREVLASQLAPRQPEPTPLT